MKHLTKSVRYKIEALYNMGVSKKEIAKELGVCLKTIYNELPRGMYTALRSDLIKVQRYSAEIAQKDYDYKQTIKGAALKLGNDYLFVAYCEDKILNHHWSPDAIIGHIRRYKLNFSCKVCSKTLYNYIDQGLLINITNKNLLRKGKNKKQDYNYICPRSKKPLARCISTRPSEVELRKTFGHWEMDTVIGKNNTKECLLVLTERLTRYEIILKIASRTQTAVEQALNRIQRIYKARKGLFKSITVDNGSEFLDETKIEKKRGSNSSFTTVYYCHPYSSWERGSNENQNGIIRRWIPKGTPLENYDDSYIASAEHWINEMPRKILNYASSSDLFNYHISQLL